MFVPFDSLPPLSRVWIYQADKKLTSEQKDIISDTLASFTEQWQVHGMPMEASFSIRYDQFVVLGANDQASGCSIDSSVRIMKDLGLSLEVDFFNRNLIAFNIGGVKLIPMSELRLAHLEKLWTVDTPMFNNLVATKEDLESRWLLPAGSTWLKRYLPQSVTP